MSDEESFVILGTSPMPSLNSNDGGDGQNPLEAENVYNSFHSLEQSQLQQLKGATAEAASLRNSIDSNADDMVVIKNNAVTDTVITNNVAAEVAVGNSPAVSIQNGHSMPNELNDFADLVDSGFVKNSYINNETVMQSSQPSQPSQPSSVHSAAAAEASLAASFILGEVDADVLKTSVYSQFPSLCSMEACAEDVLKLQNLMTEYVELKNTLAKVNITMKQFYEKTQQWRNEMERMEQQYKQQLSECQAQIAALRNENLELKREVETKIEQVKIFDSMRQKEHMELVQQVSEKSALFGNMRAQIEKLEKQQLATFEYVPKNDKDSKDKPDYVDRLEHQRVVKDFERKMSALLAENLDLKDVQQHYIDEITCLKVNLTAAEEYIKQSRADILMLKSKDSEKSKIFAKYEADREEMKEELTLLRQQVDVYSKDFEMERIARQNLAGEKDQLLQDLRTLQRKNQELIETTQKKFENFERRASAGANANPNTHAAATGVGIVETSAPIFTATTSDEAFFANSAQRPIRPLPQATNGAPVASLHRCPICSKSFTSLSILQRHVNDCLDKTN